MKKTEKDTEIISFTNKCTCFIRKQQSNLNRTDSQVPAIGQVWFWEVDLKQIRSTGEFINWFCNTFSPKYLESLSGQNDHLKTLYRNFANFALKEAGNLGCFSKEERQNMESAINEELDSTEDLDDTLLLDRTPPLSLKAFL